MYEINDIVWLGPMIIILPIVSIYLIDRLFNGKNKLYGDPSLVHEDFSSETQQDT